MGVVSPSLGGDGDGVALPRLGPGILPRPRLVELCLPLAPVTIVQAARWYGRSTFLAQHALRMHQRGHLVVRFDSRHAPDGGSMLDALRTGLRATRDRRDPAPPSDVESLSDQISKAARPISLIVDNAGGEPEETLRTLVTLLERQRYFYVTLSVTSQHPLGALASDAVLGQRFVTAPELAFTVDETTQLISRRGLSPGLDTAQRLHKMVAGWPGLLVGLLAASETGWPKTRLDPIARLLEEVDLPELGAPGDLAAFCLTPPVHASTWLEIAQHLDEDPSGRGPLTRLRDLEVMGTVTRDGTDPVHEPLWSIPLALREPLAARVAVREPRRVIDAHRALARAVVTGRHVSTTLHHAVCGEDWSLAEEVFAAYGLSLFTDPGSPVLVDSMQIPAHVRQSSPLLEYAHALWEAVQPGDPRSTRLAVLALERLLAGPKDSTRLERPSPGEHLPHLAAARHLALQTRDLDPNRRRAASGDAESYFASWSQMVSLMDTTLQGEIRGALSSVLDPALPRGPAQPDSSAALSAVRALLFAFTGSVAASTEALASSRRAGRDPLSVTMIRGLQALAEAHISIARVDLDRLDGSLSDARAHAADRDLFWPFYVHALAMRALLRGCAAQGVAVLDHAWNANDATSAPIAEQLLTICRAELLCALGELNRARALLRELGDTPTTAPTQARLHLVAGEYDVAATLASRYAWQPGTSLGDRIALLAIDAAASSAQGAHDYAARSFQQAYELARAEDTPLHLALMPLALRRSLTTELGFRARAPWRAKLERIANLYPVSTTLVHLSPREHVVLQLLHRHETIADVAHELTLSVNTVKKQTLSIYAKLGANDRASALRRARELGLLVAGTGNLSQPSWPSDGRTRR